MAVHAIEVGLAFIQAAEGGKTGQHFVNHTAETIDIGSMIDLIGSDLLGTHIFQGTDIGAKLGHAGRAENQCDTKIDQIWMPVRPQQYIGRLNVPVNHTPAVGKIQCFEYTPRNMHGFFDGKPAA